MTLTPYGRKVVLIVLALAVALTYCYRANCESRWAETMRGGER